LKLEDGRDGVYVGEWGSYTLLPPF
jgi:hypothetical protein